MWLTNHKQQINWNLMMTYFIYYICTIVYNVHMCSALTKPDYFVCKHQSLWFFPMHVTRFLCWCIDFSLIANLRNMKQ